VLKKKNHHDTTSFAIVFHRNATSFHFLVSTELVPADNNGRLCAVIMLPKQVRDLQHQYMPKTAGTAKSAELSARAIKITSPRNDQD